MTAMRDSLATALSFVAFDYGVKYNILRMLVACGCCVTVLPVQTPASAALALNPICIFSNGPGD